MPADFDPSVKAMAMLRDNKQAASKEDVRHGYSPVGLDESPKFGNTDASPNNKDTGEQRISMEQYLKEPLDAYVSKNNNKVTVEFGKQRVTKRQVNQ